MKKANGAREVLAPQTAFKHIDRWRGTRAHTLTVLFCFVLFLVTFKAAMFMEHWKRRQMRLNYEWDLTGFEDEEVSRDLNVAKLTNTLFEFEEFPRQKTLYLLTSSFIFQVYSLTNFSLMQ